jgi:hypothetical protein
MEEDFDRFIDEDEECSKVLLMSMYAGESNQVFYRGTIYDLEVEFHRSFITIRVNNSSKGCLMLWTIPLHWYQRGILSTLRAAIRRDLIEPNIYYK